MTERMSRTYKKTLDDVVRVDFSSPDMGGGAGQHVSNFLSCAKEGGKRGQVGHYDCTHEDGQWHNGEGGGSAGLE